MHAGRQDIALLRRALRTDVANVFDTQVAAGFTGLAAQISYDSLLHETLGLRLAKSASFTRWDKRPLSAEQLAYAREDVVHLLQPAGCSSPTEGARSPAMGDRRSARRWRGPPTSATPRRSSRACRGSLPPRPPPKRSHAIWCSGARRPPSARTVPSRACCPTPRWSRSHAAALPRSASSQNIRGLMQPVVKRSGARDPRARERRWQA